MEFSAFEQSLSGNVITLYNISPIQNVKNIKYYQEVVTGAFQKKEFRWSWDKSYWSSWEILNQGNMKNVVPTAIQKSLYLEFRYVRHSPNSGTVSKLTISYQNIAGTTTSGSGDTACPPGKTQIDADLLNGKPGSYYLWRGNHKGTQPISTIDGLGSLLNSINNDLNNSIIDGFNVDGSGIGVFYQKTNQALYFKRIRSANDDIVVSENNGIITLAFDASLASKDPSVNQIYTIINDLSINIYDISIYIDNKFSQIDSSLDEIYDIINALDLSVGGENLGGGLGEIFKDTSANVLRFRTIRGGGSVDVSTNENEVIISIDASTLGKWSDPDTVSTDVGAIKSGYDISIGTTSIEIFEQLFYEYFPPALDVSIVFDGGGVPETLYLEKYGLIPTDYDVSMYYNCVSKVNVDTTSPYTIYNALDPSDPSTQNFVIDPTSGYINFTYLFPDPSGPITKWHDADLTLTLPNQFKSVSATDVDYLLGSIRFRNPYYYGLVAETVTVDNITQLDITNLDKLSHIGEKASHEISFDNSTGERVKILYAYDVSYGELDSIIDKGNNFNILSNFDSSTITISIGPSQYRFYIKNHWIDASSFKVSFNI